MDSDDIFDIRKFVPYLLTQAAEESSLAFQKIYNKRHAISRTEWRVIFHLGNFGCLNARDIARSTKTNKTKISRAVQNLFQRAYLTRTQDKKDRRLEWLELTSDGMEVYLDLKEFAMEHDKNLLASFSEKECQILKKILIKLAKSETKSSQLSRVN